MADSVYKDVLLDNRLHTERYINDTITLAKSIVLKNDDEAKLYNKLIIYSMPNYANIQLELEERSKWRYYYHLAGKLHPVDHMLLGPMGMYITSMDTGEVISLDKDNLDIHRLTRRELLKFGVYYNDLVSRYKDMELLIKSIINDVDLDIDEIIAMEDYTIVSYNKTLVEPQEYDLMLILQERINNYKVQNLLPFYQHSDNLYLAAAYVVLYNYIVTTLLGIRLSKDKTPQVHSYHLFNYLASHLRLDNEYEYLSREQVMFLYRNVLYLNNHTGMNRILYDLVENIFRDRGMDFTSYDYEQLFSVNPLTNQVDYVFKQRTVHRGPEELSIKDYSLRDIIEKEIVPFPKNEREYEFTEDQIKEDFHYSLYNKLKTKDFESIFINDSNSVKYKIYDVVLDNIFYYAHYDLLKPLITFTNPSDNRSFSLPLMDALKMFTICLHLYNGYDMTISDEEFSVSEEAEEDPVNWKGYYDLTDNLPTPIHLEEEEWLDTSNYDKERRYTRIANTFPGYRSRRIFREDRHPKEYYMDRFLNIEVSIRDKLEEVIADNVVFLEEYNLTNFKETLIDIYRKELALWLLETNEGSIYNHANFQWLNMAVHKDFFFDFDNYETPSEFITRHALTDLKETTRPNLENLMMGILNGITDNLFLELGRVEDIQKALVRVFEKFRSYTTHVIDTYTEDDVILVGPKDTRMFFLEVENIFRTTDPSVRLFIESVEGDEIVVPELHDHLLNGYVQRASTQEELEWLAFNKHIIHENLSQWFKDNKL